MDSLPVAKESRIDISTTQANYLKEKQYKIGNANQQIAYLNEIVKDNKDGIDQLLFALGAVNDSWSLVDDDSGTYLRSNCA